MSPSKRVDNGTAVLASTPLVSLPTVSLDTETTGLDTTTARIVQLGAIGMLGPKIDPNRVFETLVNPGSLIPAASTAIHGISDGDVEAAPKVNDVIPRLSEFVGDSVVIGHTIGFDLEILQRQADLTGVDWPTPKALDVRLLAQIAIPDLADYGLDALCDHLEIEIQGRHSAIGDAKAAAAVFAALIPRLRRRGIRTITEAESAVRHIGKRQTASSGTPGYNELPNSNREDTRALERIDSYPYRHRVTDVMSSPPVTLAANRSLREAADILIGRGISSVFVTDEAGEPGIVTERDVLRAVQAQGGAALDAKLGEFQSKPLYTVSAQSRVYKAIGRMDRLGVRHLGVTDSSGALVGAVTTRNLLRHRATTAMILGDQLTAAESVHELAETWAKVPVMAERLVDEDVDPRMIADVISTEICILTRRAAELGEARMRAAGRDGPPMPYAVLVLGSGGRGESLLAPDQDNAIVYERGAAGGAEDAWFAALGSHIADILDEVGIPYCKGGVMAREPAWRKSLDDWKATVDHWVGRQSPEDLLNVDIFYDARTVHGDRTLGDAAWSYAYEHGAKVPSFWRALSGTLTSWRKPIGTFGGFRTGRDERLDLKLGGLMPIFTAARLLSIKVGAKVRDTPSRLRSAAEAGLASQDQIEGLVEAHHVILGAMLRQQIADIAGGVRLGPRVNPCILSKAGRTALRDALRRVPGAIDLARERMF